MTISAIVVVWKIYARPVPYTALLATFNYFEDFLRIRYKCLSFSYFLKGLSYTLRIFFFHLLFSITICYSLVTKQSLIDICQSKLWSLVTSFSIIFLGLLSILFSFPSAIILFYSFGGDCFERVFAAYF